MTTPMTLYPAYGRNYKTAKEVKAAWTSGKDFLIADIMHKYYGKPVNEEQVRDPNLTIIIRYKGNEKLVVAEWKAGVWKFK